MAERRVGAVLRALTKDRPAPTPDAEECGCETNAIGDIRCHQCGERVNIRCWKCGTPRGGGYCPSPRGVQQWP